MSITTLAVETQGREHLNCFDCNNLLAYRHRDGTVEVMVRTRERWHRNGYLIVECPRCGRECKLQPKKAA